MINLLASEEVSGSFLLFSIPHEIWYVFINVEILLTISINWEGWKVESEMNGDCYRKGEMIQPNC